MSVTKDVTSGKRKTAFLVVHGVGQHEKYETLACFAAGMMQSLQLDVPPERVLVPFDDGVESALTLQTHAYHIDILEYYYQPYLQRVVKTSDVIGFVFRTINCVKGLYKKYDFDSEGAAGEQNAAQKKRPDEDLIVWHYLIKRPATLPSKLVSWTLRGIYFVWSRMPNFLQKPFEWLASFFVERYVTEVLGDLVAYLAIDPKSRLNGKRREILSGCEKRIKELLSRMGEAGYDQVVVAGHSLGSVVAYDALSRIARDASCGRFSVAACDKLAGFLTFGSPLDKVAFVFWPSSNDVLERGGNEWERLQKNLYTGLLPHFYGIRCSAALSLVILDEIGRGTSTLDGYCIARAVLEFLHGKGPSGPRTLFATHFHEIVSAESDLKRVKNFHFAVRDTGTDVIFLRKLIPGATDRSYGIHVASLAGVPDKVTDRATTLLSQIMKGEGRGDGRVQRYTQMLLVDTPDYPPEDSVVRELRDLNPDDLSPREALDLLYNLVARAAGREERRP